MTCQVPSYFPPFLWKFWLSEVGPNRADFQRLHIYSSCDGELHESKRAPVQLRSIFQDFEPSPEDSISSEQRTQYLDVLHAVQASFTQLENTAESVLTDILQRLQTGRTCRMRFSRSHMMTLRKFFIFLWYRNSRNYSEMLLDCDKQHLSHYDAKRSTEPESIGHSQTISFFRKKTILRGFHRLLELNHCFLPTCSTSVDERFIKLCRPDTTELVISVAPGKQQYIMSDTVFQMLDEPSGSQFGDMFFPLTPTTVIYLMERPEGFIEPSPAFDIVSVCCEVEEDVDIRNMIVFGSNPNTVYFSSLNSIVTSITKYEQTFKPGSVDYSNLRARCRQRALQESVTKTLVLRDSLTVTDLSDEVSLVGESAIAFGSFADIWKGVWKHRSGKEIPVAVKVLRRVMVPDLKDKLFKRLKDEVLAWHRLHHPHIASLHGIVQLQTTLGMASTWCNNGTVVGYLKEGNPNADRVQLLAQVASGVAYLHNFKPTVIHGDLKGCNILVDDNGLVKITDFGLSKVIEDFSDTLHIHIPTSFFAGSTRWMAPELVLALVEEDGEVDEKTGVINAAPPPITTFSDIYAFGAVGIEILTGMLPFPYRSNDHAVTVDIMRGVKPSRGVSRNLSKYSWLEQSKSDELWDLLDRCWSPDWQCRPSMSQIVVYLEGLLVCKSFL